MKVKLSVSLFLFVLIPALHVLGSQDNKEDSVDIQKQWAFSQHANSMNTPEENESMNKTGCAHCHTAQGYWEVILEKKESSAPYKEAFGITCAACHFSEKLEEGDSALRAGSAEHACTGCHDILVQNDEAGFSACLQGSVLGNEGGSEFEDEFYSKGPHSKVENGCVGCHMSESPEGEQGLKLGGHTFRVMTKGEDPKIFNPAGCLDCHPGIGLEDVAKSQKKTKEQMDVLEELLPEAESKESDQAHPAPKFPKDPSLSKIEAKASFNYYYVLKDGTLGVHNPVYIRKLLEDSIQALLKDKKRLN